MSDVTRQTSLPAIETVVLVGHCGFDGSSIRRLVSQAVPDVEIVFANATRDLEEHRNHRSLWLVNRQLDGGFATHSGIDLIRESVGGDDAPLAMLVSNYEDAQTQAEAAGALPGFGKNALGAPATTEALRRAVAGEAAVGDGAT